MCIVPEGISEHFSTNNKSNFKYLGIYIPRFLQSFFLPLPEKIGLNSWKAFLLKSSPTQCQLRSKRLTMKSDVVWEKKSQLISMKFYQKTSLVQSAINFSSFEYMKIAIRSPLQSLKLSWVTKWETQQFWFNTKQLIPFQTIFYCFYCMFGTLQDFWFCNLTMPLDWELTGYICFFTVTTIYVSIFTCKDQVLSNCERSFPDVT